MDGHTLILSSSFFETNVNSLLHLYLFITIIVLDRIQQFMCQTPGRNHQIKWWVNRFISNVWGRFTVHVCCKKLRINYILTSINYSQIFLLVSKPRYLILYFIYFHLHRKVRTRWLRVTFQSIYLLFILSIHA